jgi:hypothetical protein
VVLAGAEVPADVVDYCDDKHVHDAYNDARYDMHAHDDTYVHDGVPVDGLHQEATADAAVRVDVVVAVRMHKCLPAGKRMRICIVS